MYQYVFKSIHSNRAVINNICDCKNQPNLYYKLNLMLLPLPIDTLNNYPFPVYQVLNVSWSAFLESILLTSKITSGTIATMEGANWVVGN